MNLGKLLSSLQNKAIIVVILFGAIAWIEFGLLRTKFKNLSGKQLQAELAQKGALTSRDFALQLQQFLQGRKELLSNITTLADRQDEQLLLLSVGGKVESSLEMIRPLSPFSKITLEQLEKAWRNYKKSAITMATHEVWKDSVVAQPAAERIDSLSDDIPPEVIKTLNPNVIEARTLLDGQWATLTTKYNELIKDLKMEERQSKESLLLVTGLAAIGNVFFIVALLLTFNRYVLKPVNLLEQAATSRTHFKGSPQTEVGRVALRLNTIIDQLNNASSFVKNIEEGNLKADYQGVDLQTSDDQLASALLAMRTKLQAMGEEEQRRKWANEGLSRFVDILRSSDNNLHVLGDKIISTLVQYTGSNQGGLYVLNDDDNQNRFLELISLFAFNTKKFEQQKLKPGEGMVGQTYLEKETIYLTEIPEDYIRITSGLGETNPKAILIVPLKVDKEVYGIVELASFREYQPHEITFVEKLGETIASTLASVKSNQSNRKLLEESKMAAESLRSQEEEMRQNMEELTATQEEMSRKETEYIQKIADLERKLSEGVPGEDWAVAMEMEKVLRINLEALSIVQEQSGK
jgi:hypothetical protein